MSRRRRYAHRNPTKNQKALIIGGVVAVAAVGGYLYWKSTQPATALPSALPPNPTPTNVVLTPGAMAAVTLSISQRGTLNITAPTGATLGTLSWSPVTQLAPSSTTNYEVVAAAIGNTTVTVTYTDSAGTPQTSTIPVTVTA